MEIKKRDLCIVHIGMPKTGSSTLQETFFKGLNDRRISYANLPHPNQSGWLNGIFCRNPELYHFCIKNFINTPERIRNFRKNTISKLIEGFKKQKTCTTLMSGEDLFHLDQAGIQELKSFLEKYFEKVLIVAYVRPVKSFLSSAFQQLVKNHELSSLDSGEIYHHYRNFERYDRVFGEENVKLFKFDPSTFPEGDIVLDFCHKLNLEPTKSKVKVVNESISKAAVSILFTYHFHANVKADYKDEKYKVQNSLVEAISKIGSEKFCFSNQFIRKVLTKFKCDYDWIEQRMGGRLDEGLDVDDTSGITTERELMVYATDFVNDLVYLIGDRPIPFKLEKHPQTVAKLVGILANKLHEEIKQHGGIFK